MLLVILHIIIIIIIMFIDCKWVDTRWQYRKFTGGHNLSWKYVYIIKM